MVKSRKGHAIGVTASERKSSVKQRHITKQVPLLCVIGQFQVWQEVWQRIAKAELANIPRIFQEDSRKLGAKPLISNNIPIIFWEYLPIRPWGSFPYMLSIPSEGP